MQRIMNELKTKTEFTVTDFLREHSKDELYKYKPIFNSRNARDRINVWIEYHKLKCKYTQHKKIWESFLDNDNDNISVNNSESLPFLVDYIKYCTDRTAKNRMKSDRRTGETLCST